jgi:hypothetical protein
LGFQSAYQPVAIIELRGLGSAEGGKLVIQADGSRRFLKIFENSARQLRVSTVSSEEGIDLSVLFNPPSNISLGEEAPKIILSR